MKLCRTRCKTTFCDSNALHFSFIKSSHSFSGRVEISAARLEISTVSRFQVEKGCTASIFDLQHSRATTDVSHSSLYDWFVVLCFVHAITSIYARKANPQHPYGKQSRKIIHRIGRIQTHCWSPEKLLCDQDRELKGLKLPSYY